MFKLTIWGWLILMVDWLIKIYVLKKISKQEVRSTVIILGLAIISSVYLFNIQVGLLFEPFYLLLLTSIFLKPKWQSAQVIFYSCVPFVLVELFQRLTGIYEIKLAIYQNMDISIDIFIICLVSLCIFLFFYYVFTRIMIIDFEGINSMFSRPDYKRVVNVLNFSLLSYAFMVQPLMILTGNIQNGKVIFKMINLTVQFNIILLYLVIFISGIVYLNYKSKVLFNEDLQAVKDNQLLALADYSRHIESLYQELRGFRHDYTNILVSLNETLSRDDLEGTKRVYESVIANSDQRFYESKYDIAKLANITNEAMKSVISAKLLAAQEQGIAISVEVLEPIDVPDMDLLDLIQILSIFLDNAIEAAVKSDAPSLRIAYFQDNKEKIMVIENTTLEVTVHTREIFKLDHSTKGDNRGIGLANVKKILSRYPKVDLETKSYQHNFSQMLIFNE